MKPTLILLLALVGLFAAASFAAQFTHSERLFAEKLAQHQLDEPSEEFIRISQANSKPVPADSELSLDGAFSLENANIFARVAAAAYCAPLSIKGTSTKLNTWTCKQCTDSGVKLTGVTPFHIAIADFYGFVGYHAPTNSVHLSFQGSANLANWLYNLNAQFVDFPAATGAQVHKGFYDMWIYSRPTVIALLDAQLYNKPAGVKVAITGHSLGGAIAQLAALDLKSSGNGYTLYNLHGIDVITSGNSFDQAAPFNLAKFPSKTLLGGSNYSLSPTLYTYGQPRVGNKVFSNYFSTKVGNSNYARLVHDTDIVPHMPPVLLWPSAQHPYFEAFYKTAYAQLSDFTLCQNAPESDLCSNQYPLPASMENHLNYLGYHLGTNNAAC